MKSIISDSLWAHMWILSVSLIFLTIIVLNEGISFLFLAFGVLIVLGVIHSAIKIADFEMSSHGELLKTINESKADFIEVNINHVSYKK